MKLVPTKPTGPSGGGSLGGPSAAPRADALEGQHPWVKLASSSTIWVLVILAALIAIFSILQLHQFLTVFNFRTLAADSSVLMVMAVGQTYVLITAGIDLSVGSVLVFASIISGKLMLSISGSPASTYGAIRLSWGFVILGGVVAVIMGIAWGLFNGLLVAYTRVPAFIVTLGSFGVALGLAEIITGGTDVRGVPSSLVNDVGNGSIFGFPILLVIGVVVAVIAGVVLRKTIFGRWTFAIGANAEAARRAGINVGRHTAAVYALSGALAGLAGFLSLAEFGTSALAGHSTDNLNTIAAAVIGGTSLFGGIGNILGTVVGVYIPAVLQDGFVIIGVTPFWQEVVVGLILIAAVYFDTAARKRRAGQ